MSAAQRSPRRAASFGPVQLARRLGWWDFQIERGLRLGLVPAPDLGGRWSAGLVEQFEVRAEQIRGEIGSLPDLGATRAATELAERFGCAVSVDTVYELRRRGVLPIADSYNGYPLFDGRAVERFADRAELDEAAAAGHSRQAAEAAAYLRIRRADFDHLVRAGLVTPARWVRSRYQRSRQGAYRVPLYRVADLDAVGKEPGIDWAAVRATKPGRVSLLASLPTATNTSDDDEQEGVEA